MAQVDYFLNIDGISGESQDKDHAGTIEIDSWSWGESNFGGGTSGGGAGRGRVSLQDLKVTAHTNKASPELMLACASGKHLSKAVLYCRKAGGEQFDFLTFQFTTVIVSTFDVVGSHGTSSTDEVIPTDQFSLNFAKIEMIYKERPASGGDLITVDEFVDTRPNANT